MSYKRIPFAIKKNLKPTEIQQIYRLRRIENNTKQWSAGANLVRANINWLDKGEKSKIAEYARKKSLPFEVAVKKHLEAARWLEFQVASEMNEKSIFGNKLPLATFLGMRSPLPLSLIAASIQLEKTDLPTYQKMNRTLKKEYLKRVQRRIDERIPTHEIDLGAHLFGITAYPDVDVTGKILQKKKLAPDDVAVFVHEMFEFYGKLRGNKHYSSTAKEKKIISRILKRVNMASF